MTAINLAVFLMPIAGILRVLSSLGRMAGTWAKLLAFKATDSKGHVVVYAGPVCVC